MSNEQTPASGGQLAGRALKQAGVEVIFTLAGGHIMPL
jgi:thiamine pyrophosphate-dependent acetolactate synthase large subunit-like protein